MNVDLIIIGTWKEKLQKETFNIPTIATVNVHPSLLPKYRGPNPYMQTILHGEEYSGVTLHLLSENFDDGPILKQEKVKILGTDTSKELREKSVRVARGMVAELIQDLSNKIVTPIAQNPKCATYFPNISGDERMLDFEKQTSVEISGTIRALHPFLPTYIEYKNKFFVVNPYKFFIIEHKVDMPAGSIIDKISETCSITVVCADNKAVQFNDLVLYKHNLKTKDFIKNKVEVILK